MATQLDMRLFVRFRHMMTQPFIFPKNISDEDLIAKLKATTNEERNHAMRVVTGLVSDNYWKRMGL